MQATAVVIEGDDIDTDVLYPGKFLSILDPAKASEHLFEGLDPGLRSLLKNGPTVLFVAENFGTGSSREQPVTAMRFSGVQCIVGKSFARIFARNAINSGMPAFQNPAAVQAVRSGQAVEVELETGTIRIDGHDFASVDLGDLPREIIRAGGLVPWVRARSRRNEEGAAGAAKVSA